MSEEPLSETSSSSSFVPVEQVHIQDAIQVIDENKRFNNAILDYVGKTSSANVGHNYHIVAVFGSQSTGKSTLLNNLFNTNFDVMNEYSRQQTTKGIWLAYSPGVSTTSGHVSTNSNILVMDVEGTDGRERGEDQDFERKAALFALSTSEVLILNIWETQVGLYQGANLGLLKTVFEVNITLFGKSKLDSTNDHKVLLLIVIRDHVGTTPVESLAETITQDLRKIWDSLSKPGELSHLRFEDFFDLDFHALNHKILQPKEFSDGVGRLGDRMVKKNDLFKPEYHHNIPVEGWTLYAEKCWEQIENNKDLDLPTQQILVAQFKCDEIVEQTFQDFLKKFNELFKDVAKEPSFEDIGALFVDLKHDVLEEYDHAAAKYNKSVYEQKRVKLESLIHSKFKEVFDLYSKQLVETAIASFKSDLAALKGKDFNQQSQILSANVVNLTKTSLGLISLNGVFSYDETLQQIEKDLADAITKQQKIELDSIVNKSAKRLSTNLSKTIQFELNDPSESTWDKILEQFNLYVNEFTSKYDGDFGLNTLQADNEEAVKKFKFKSWNYFYDLIHKFIYKERVLDILQSRFDDKFRYDSNGLPKLYQDARELETSFAIAKEHALAVLPILTIAKLGDDSEIVPDFDIFSPKLRLHYLNVKSEQSDDEDDDEDESHSFADIISEAEKSHILSKFKKEIDAKFVETKRSIVQHVTQIPYYVYLIIIALGWNEFMAVVRNPFTFALAILFAASIYILYTLNLLKPAIAVGQRLIDDAVIIAKEKLREVLIDDHEIQARNLDKMTGKVKQAHLDKEFEGETIVNASEEKQREALE
ncbi:SEY1 [Candida theae]|uniref:SEY1 n=1 Tax=Candida theae TaxID=1198502 RepID=A0AAD5BHI1_9ASCO|nr:SEY1 [Candida theae]KAI5963861.1 SEY1 [Candida theae]